ncbi:hypothetical protein TrST_g5469 [Triparma strigata]|uniref:Uncharacterized protein n=1 Tax=Triparma strigata TaxID=1606541 RepID=A0A9W7ET59_9STRA|nr:hypothetical protein TrST_g5469 [Triparma strigata]
MSHGRMYARNVIQCLSLVFALVACLGPYYSYERTQPNLPGAVKGEVGLWVANGSPMFCSDGAVYFLGSPAPVTFDRVLGDCSFVQLNVVRAFSIMAVVFSGLAFFFASVTDHIISPRSITLIQFSLSVASLISTIIVISTYDEYINPERDGNAHGACELSPAFSGLECSEWSQWGFWFNIGCVCSSSASIIFLFAKLKSLRTDDLHKYASETKVLHMSTMTKLLRFVNFFVILLATLGAYVELNPVSNEYLELTFATVKFSTTSIYTSLWDGSLCWGGGFYDTFKLFGSPENYGDCSHSTIRLVQSFIVISLVLSAFNAIGSDEHARSAFVSAVILVVSLIFELLTLVFLIAAAAIYQIYIFPGRLNENYCSLKGIVGFNGISFGCKQTLGYGAFMLYLAIGVTSASFLLAIMAPIQEMEDLLDAIKQQPTSSCSVSNSSTSDFGELELQAGGDEEEGGRGGTAKATGGDSTLAGVGLVWEPLGALTPAVTHTALTLDTVTPLGGSGTPESETEEKEVELETDTDSDEHVPEVYQGLDRARTEDLWDLGQEEDEENDSTKPFDFATLTVET